MYLFTFSDENNMEYFVHMTMGYFIYDLMKLLYYNYTIRMVAASKNVEVRQTFVYILHHVVTIYLIGLIFTKVGYPPILYSIYMMEASNVMLYVSYQLHKEYKHRQDLIAISEGVQLISNCYYRVYFVNVFIYEHREYLMYKAGIVEQLCVATIYFMGMIWTYVLFLKNIQNYKKMVKN